MVIHIVDDASKCVKMDSPKEIALSSEGDGEALIPLNQAAPLFRGADPPYPTLARWATVGVRGVVLATIRVGARRFVTRRAVADFLSALNS